MPPTRGISCLSLVLYGISQDPRYLSYVFIGSPSLPASPTGWRGPASASGTDCCFPDCFPGLMWGSRGHQPSIVWWIREVRGVGGSLRLPSLARLRFSLLQSHDSQGQGKSQKYCFNSMFFFYSPRNKWGTAPFLKTPLIFCIFP